MFATYKNCCSTSALGTLQCRLAHHNKRMIIKFGVILSTWAFSLHGVSAAPLDRNTMASVMSVVNFLLLENEIKEANLEIDTIDSNIYRVTEDGFTVSFEQQNADLELCFNLSSQQLTLRINGLLQTGENQVNIGENCYTIAQAQQGSPNEVVFQTSAGTIVQLSELSLEFAYDPTTSVTRTDAVRFLVQATYGPTDDDIDDVQDSNYEDWVAQQMSMDFVSWVDRIAVINESETAYRWYLSGLFWEGAIEGQDQLRQRVAFALSQIIANNNKSDLNHARPEIFAYYWDIFQTHAFGNYADLLYEISLSPSMGMFLTHLNNEKEDIQSGTAPDENFAREIMQLFTIGLVDLDMAGQSNGVESYTTDDVQQLARVFTGFSWDDGRFGGRLGSRASSVIPMAGFDSQHEFGDKTFLGQTISGTSTPEESVALAIGILVNHPNTAPFISKQFIQKLVTSNPSGAYVRRVSTAFRDGRYTMPSGAVVGTGRSGDMAAMIMAILLDKDARNPSSANSASVGKVRGPILRQAQWARTFRDDEGRDINGVPPPFRADWTNTGMGQTVHQAPSVFSFYRPGYVLPDSDTADRGLVNPEMQMVTASTTYGYLQYMSNLITETDVRGLDFFKPDYTIPIGFANEASSLTDYLNEMMVYGTLTDEVYNRVISGIEATTIDGLTGDNLQEALRERVEIAMMIIIASPEYITQR